MVMEITNKTMDLLKKHDISFDESLFARKDQYERDSQLKPKNNIIIEAKRLILNEQFDKMINVTLCEFYNPIKPANEKICSKQNIDFNEPIPPPHITLQKSLKVYQTSVNNFDLKHLNLKNIPNNASLIEQIDEIKTKHDKIKWNFKLQAKYFKLWKEKVKNQKLGVAVKEIEPHTLDNFIKKLEKKKKEIPIKQNVITKIKIKQPVLYENRYKAQKTIIVMQKSKLLEQEKIIEELKYGKVCKELDASIAETKNELKEIYNNFSVKTKTKLGVANGDTVEEIQMKIKKAPKIVKDMQKRADEREAKRQATQERKKCLDEERKRAALEIIENKRMQDEESRLKNLEAIKERRRTEMEKEKERQYRKEMYLEKCYKADYFYKMKLKRFTMDCFGKLIQIKIANEYKCEIFHETTIINKCFKNWSELTMNNIIDKTSKADAMYRKKLMRKCYDSLVLNLIEAKNNYQVAEDYFDLKVQLRVFRLYRNCVCREKMRRYSLYVKAINHYNSRILVQYFYQWRSLPAVILLEKAKAEKKRKWREKVMQILPDYRPPIDDDY